MSANRAIPDSVQTVASVVGLEPRQSDLYRHFAIRRGPSMRRLLGAIRLFALSVVLSRVAPRSRSRAPINDIFG
jgi:hypothetical protein